MIAQNQEPLLAVDAIIGNPVDLVAYNQEKQEKERTKTIKKEKAKEERKQRTANIKKAIKNFPSTAKKVRKKKVSELEGYDKDVKITMLILKVIGIIAVAIVIGLIVLYIVGAIIVFFIIMACFGEVGENIKDYESASRIRRKEEEERQRRLEFENLLDRDRQREEDWERKWRKKR